MSLKTEVVTVKHSVDSKSVDVALCKSRLDVVDKNMADVITKLKHIPIKNSNVHQSGQNVYPNENQQSMPILVSGNATREQIPSPGQRRVVDIVSRGVTQPKTGIRWSRVDCTENDTSAIPKTASFSKIQIGHTLGYLNNREDILKILVKMCLSLVMEVIENIVTKRLRWWLILLITEDQDPESLRLMKLMNSNLQHIHHQMIGIGDHHINEILIDWILPIFNVERFPEVIPYEILKIMSVQSTYVAAIPAVTTIILLKDC